MDIIATYLEFVIAVSCLSTKYWHNNTLWPKGVTIVLDRK